MKPKLLSITLIAAFALYAYTARLSQSQVNNQITATTTAPSSNSTQPTSTPLPTARPSIARDDDEEDDDVSIRPRTQAAPATPVTPTQQPATTMMGSNGSGMGMMGSMRSGTYTGLVADAFYGNVQVKVTISRGKLTNVDFLQYPNDRQTSRMINSQAMPLLAKQAITAQSAQVDGVSGASATSQAFVQSLSDALAQAKA